MGKKGKQKAAQMREEVQEDDQGFAGLGDLFEDEGGMSPRGGESWGIQPNDSVSNVNGGGWHQQPVYPTKNNQRSAAHAAPHAQALMAALGGAHGGGWGQQPHVQFQQEQAEQPRRRERDGSRKNGQRRKADDGWPAAGAAGAGSAWEAAHGVNEDNAHERGRPHAKAKKTAETTVWGEYDTSGGGQSKTAAWGDWSGQGGGDGWGAADNNVGWDGGFGVPAPEPKKQSKRGGKADRNASVNDGGWSAGGANQGTGEWGAWGPQPGTGWDNPIDEEEEEEQPKRKKKNKKGDSGHRKEKSGWDSAADTGWGEADTGWTNANSGWTAAGQQQHQAADGWAGGGHSQVGSWGAWGAQATGKTPKVTVTSPSAEEENTVLSEKENAGQNSLFGLLRSLKSGGKGSQSQKKGGKKSKHRQPHSSPWPSAATIQEEEEDIYDDDEPDDRVTAPTNIWFSNSGGSAWDDPTYSMPSKAFAIANDGRSSGRKQKRDNPYMDTQFIESNGAALVPAQRAFYSQERLARHRIHWLFNPDKDERVSSLLSWVQAMSYDLATLGLSKFLETRERGALFTNADYHPPTSATEPAFDWVGYDSLQETMDRTLQESVAFYDPSTQVLVFVFLLSQSGNSMAIWRRKLILPNNLRLAYGTQIAQAKRGLRSKYPIYIDEVPGTNPTPTEATAQPQRRLSKKKWYKRFL